MAKRFVVPVKCKVLEANYFTETIRGQNGICGPGYGSWETGQIINVALKVSSAAPLTHLDCPGYTFVKRGDILIASIDLTEEYNQKPNGTFIGGKEGYNCDYRQREITTRETATKLELLTEDRETVLATFNFG